MQHLLDLKDWNKTQVEDVLSLATKIKRTPSDYKEALKDKILVMLFEKPSLRTRISFESGMFQMGGHAIYYDMATSPLARGKESVHDTVKVLGRYANLILARLFKHSLIEEMARYSDIPVINGLTDFAHPCQALSDLLTIQEEKGKLHGINMTYMGDAYNNVTHSLMYACALVGINLKIGCPEGSDYSPDEQVMKAVSKMVTNGAKIQIIHDPIQAITGADVVYTDSWMSYHISHDKLEARLKVFQPYQINQHLWTYTDKEAIFMNCLPAQRGYEQSADIIDGKQSVIFNQAENRLHMHKAIMLKVSNSQY